MQTIIKASRKKNRSGRRTRGPRYWIVSLGTMGAIVAFTVGNSRAMSVAYAERDGNTLTISGRSEREPAKIEFKIPSGPLETVIAAFEKTAGVKITVYNPEILNIQSLGVVGSFTVDQAMELLLKGTGVSYTTKDSKLFVLGLQAEAASVEIYNSNTAVVASPKYTEPLRDIPQTVSVITKETIEQQGATTLRDVLNNVPGITIVAGEGGAPAGDNLTIRGFSARNDIYVDGVRDLGAQSRDAFNLEQVEVVKGPSSTFTGRGSTGGTINLVNKLPNLRRSVSGSFMVGNADTKRGTVDVNLPIGDTIGFRLNLMGHDANAPGREDVQNRRWGAAPSIAFGLGTPTRYSFSYFYLEQNNTSDYGIPWVPATNNVLVEHRNRPAPVPRSTFYGILARDHEKLRSELFTVRFEHEFNDNLTIRNQFRYGYSRRDSIATPPRFANNNSTVITREMRSWLTDDDIWDNQTDLTYRFRTGGIQHAAVFGTSLSCEKNHRILRTAPNSLTTLLDPNPHDMYTGTFTINPLEGDVTGKSFAGYFFDTIKFSRRWEFVGGLRWDRFDVEGVNVAGNSLVPLARVDKILSGRAALIFKPVESGTFYASYGTSANPSLEGLLYSPADVRTDPEKTRTFEVGTKWELLQNRLLLSGAVFRVQKTNARTPSLIAGEPPTLDGDQKIDGVEFSATGNITPDWQVFTGYTFLDSEIVRSNTAAEVGSELINTPRNSFNLWTTYRREKFFFGFGPRFVGRRYGNNINTRVADSYWVVDAMASYK
ncbi:MAG: TonB-dependent siderophore receptor, partial [Pyrinomonadaceae bacterium]